MSTSSDQDCELLASLIARIEHACPHREPTSAQERAAQDILAEQFQSRGLAIQWQPFRFSRNLYAAIALHLAVAFIGGAFLWHSAWLGMAIMAIAGFSYALDSHARGFWLRRLLGYRDSQNLLATLPASGTMRHRYVFVAHADAAPTGWMFTPWFLYLTLGPFPNHWWLLRKQILHWVVSLVVMALLPLLSMWWQHWSLTALYGIILFAWAYSFTLLLQVALSRRIVPGANDNLSGCAALVLLAERFAKCRPQDIELVFVVTGCEESGRGGASALVCAKDEAWRRDQTTCLIIDTVSGGDLRYLVEGEIVPIAPAGRLVVAATQVAAEMGWAATFRAYHAAAGVTDAAPLLTAGYEAIAFARINRQSDITSDYHRPSDSSENLIPQDVLGAVDFAERLVTKLESV